MVAAPPPPLVSYADSLHGWRAAGPGVEATNDGGKHWRVVFRSSRVVTLLVRTSPGAGLVTFDAARTYVTNDGGAHWFETNRPIVEADGRGPLLFESRGGELLRAMEWPLPDTELHRGAVIHTRVMVIAAQDGQSLRITGLAKGGVRYDVIDPDGHTVVDSGVLAIDAPVASWADRDHGWRAADAGLEATEDGGHHWRLLLRTERSSGASIDGAIRTSARSGLVAVSGRLLVTNDGGRHWYQARGVGASAPSFGRGSLLFGTGGTGIDKAVNWPLTRLACTGRWVHSAEYFNLLTAGPRPRTVCLQDDGPTIRMRRIWTLPPHEGDWIVYGRVLSRGQFDADVLDMTTEQGTYVGSVYYRDGRVTFVPTR